MVRKPRVKGKHGMEISGVTVAFIAAILMLVVLFIIFSKSTKQPLALLKQEEWVGDNRACYMKAESKTSCVPSPTDKDGDCLPDSCDFCIDETAKIATDDASKQAAGSNFFDCDGDYMPNLCDKEPLNSAVNNCDLDSRGKCKIPAKHIGKTGQEIQMQDLLKVPGCNKKIDDIIVLA